MLMLIFLMLFKVTFALTLDESLVLYKDDSKYKDNYYEAVYFDYNRNYIFNAHIEDSGLAYSTYTSHQDHALQDHHLRNMLTPRMSIYGLDISGSWRFDYNIGNSAFESRWSGLQAGIDLMDIFYYGGPAYYRDSAYYSMLQEETSNKAKDLDNMYGIVDLYVQIQKLDGNIDISERFLEQLYKDKESLKIKEQAGLVSKMELEAEEVEILKTENQIQSLKRSSHIRKLDLCQKLKISFDDQSFLPFEEEDLEDVVYDEANLELLKHSLHQKEAAASYQFRQMLPNLNVNASYQWNEALARYDGSYGLGIGWEIWPNSAEYLKASKAAELAKDDLDKAIASKGLRVEERRAQLLSLKEKVAVLQKHFDYLQKAVKFAREKYIQDLISFDEYSKNYNNFKDKEIELSEARYDLSAFIKKMKLLLDY